MKSEGIGFAVLASVVVLSVALPLIPQIFATCYSNPLVGIGLIDKNPNYHFTGVYMWVSKGYGGYTGQQLVTAQHIASGSTVDVYTNCGSYLSRSVLASSVKEDWAVISTSGITFSSYYNQATGSVGEGVNVNSYSIGTAPATVKMVSGWLQQSYYMELCSTSTKTRGLSGAPAQDSVTNVVVGITSATDNNTNDVKTYCGSGYSEIITEYNGS